jgi:CHASE2 domain-containing sensor protein
MPATVVAIDEKSLTALGQWPWPRTGLAQLVDAIARERPAAIAVDILMPEADALSPESVLARTLHQDPAVVGALRGLTSNDTQLARALASAQAVLAVAGTTEPTGMPLRAPTFGVSDSRQPRDKPPSHAIAQVAGADQHGRLDRAASDAASFRLDAGGVIRRTRWLPVSARWFRR